MVMVEMLPDVTISGKSKMAAVKPEVYLYLNLLIRFLQLLSELASLDNTGVGL